MCNYNTLHFSNFMYHKNVKLFKIIWHFRDLNLPTSAICYDYRFLFQVGKWENVLIFPFFVKMFFIIFPKFLFNFVIMIVDTTVDGYPVSGIQNTKVWQFVAAYYHAFACRIEKQSAYYLILVCSFTIK